MNTCFDYLDAIEATGSTKKKVEIAQAALNDPRPGLSDHLRALIRFTFDYELLFFIKELPTSDKTWDGLSNDSWLGRFNALLEECQVTGRTQETKQKVADWLASQDPQIGKWCRRVLLRDLKAGFSSELALKAGFEFPVFEAMLATSGKKCKKLDKMTKAGMFKSPKLNGYRCIAELRGNEVYLKSRNGVPLANFPTVEKATIERFGPFGDRVFDGEIMSDSFNAMQQSAFASKRGTTVGDVYYAIFGTISIEEWDSEVFTTPYRESRAKLEELFKLTEAFECATDSPTLRLVEASEVPADWTLDDWVKFERECVEKGYEGGMGNPADEPYYMGRKANALLKFKTMESMDCPIVEANPGDPDGKRNGMLGSFTVRQENGKLCNVGGGYKDDELVTLWDKRGEMIGRVMEVYYQELSPEGIMLFPVFKRWRPDKE